MLRYRNFGKDQAMPQAPLTAHEEWKAAILALAPESARHGALTWDPNAARLSAYMAMLGVALDQNCSKCREKMIKGLRELGEGMQSARRDHLDSGGNRFAPYALNCETAMIEVAEMLEVLGAPVPLRNDTSVVLGTFNRT